MRPTYYFIQVYHKLFVLISYIFPNQPNNLVNFNDSIPHCSESFISALTISNALSPLVGSSTGCVKEALSFSLLNEAPELKI